MKAANYVAALQKQHSQNSTPKTALPKQHSKVQELQHRSGSCVSNLDTAVFCVIDDDSVWGGAACIITLQQCATRRSKAGAPGF